MGWVWLMDQLARRQVHRVDGQCVHACSAEAKVHCSSYVWQNIRKLLGHACTHDADLQRACTPSATRSNPSYALHTNSACTLAHGAIAAGTRGEASTDSVRWHRSYELRDICRAMQNPCALAAHLAPRRLLGRRPGLQPRGADTSGRGQFHLPRPWRPTVIVAESTLRSNA